MSPSESTPPTETELVSDPRIEPLSRWYLAGLAAFFFVLASFRPRD